MVRKTPLALAVVLAASAVSTVWAQSVISAHSGVIHLAEGQVELDGTEVHQKFGEFGDVKSGQTLAAKDGRAEVLLTPGVFLRLAENSSFKMVSNKLVDTKIEVLNGSVMVQVDELLADNAITVAYRGSDVTLLKKGIYRLDGDKASLKVFDGEAKVVSGSQNLVAKKGKEVQLGDTLEASNFDAKQTDEFYRWNERRDEYISEANISAAKSASDQGMMYTNGYQTAAGAGMWSFNPYFGMFTYMPYNGMFYSPFGYGYYSPGMVGYLYMPGSPYYLNNGANVGGMPVSRNPVVASNTAHPTFRGGSGPSMGGAASNRGAGLMNANASPSLSGGGSGGSLGGGSAMSGGMGGGAAARGGSAGGGGRH